MRVDMEVCCLNRPITGQAVLAATDDPSEVQLKNASEEVQPIQ